MSRRSATTITATVKLRIPPGSSAAAVLEYITHALREHKSREYDDSVIPGIDTDSMIVKLTHKETVYL